MPNIECAVCSEEFGQRNDTRDIIITPCGHVYHEPCLSKWLQFGTKLDEAPRTCPECRQPVSMSATRRIYFNFSTVIDNYSEHINYLNSVVLEKNNKLYITRMQLNNIESEYSNQLRTKSLEVQGLTEKLQHLKLEYNKLKHLMCKTQDQPKQLQEKIAKLKMKLKESKHKPCSTCQASCRVNLKDATTSSNVNENMFNQTPQFNPTEAIAVNQIRTMQPNNCDPSTSIFNQNLYMAQSSRTPTTIPNPLDYDINTINTINTNFRSIRHPLSQSAYMSTNPMQTFGSMIAPIQPAHATQTPQQQHFTYSQTNFFLPIQTTNSINTTYFNPNDQTHYIG
ncbi:uncharacterized protein LOC116337504 [Contarinia nasturtii]|uniref:uncharacterized protein LOC116337504 n=1 Tax=Contarinia nasturtii TaxID=265458 RepID=UPI0012D387D6|nr:uncharacterized protein LOC116337504 [Contarinia nasturtii]